MNQETLTIIYAGESVNWAPYSMEGDLEVSKNLANARALWPTNCTSINVLSWHAGQRMDVQGQ